MRRNIGIDFGTSSTIMYIKDFANNGEECQQQPVLFNGSPIIPTVAFVADNDFSREENFTFGQDAIYCQNDGAKYINFKLMLISVDDEERQKAQKLTEYFFNWLFKSYVDQKFNYGECDEEKTFISYPVKWNESLKDFMVTTAKRAGFNNVLGKDEASAAIQGLLFSKLETLQRYGILKRGEKLKVLLLDMGAGTTDIVLGNFDTSINKLDVIFTYPASENDILFGGKEFDEKICEIICAYLEENGNSLRFEKKILIPDCKTWKENALSPSLQKKAEIKQVPAFLLALLSGILGAHTSFPTINRQFFEDRFKDNIDEFTDIIEQSVSSAIEKTGDADLKENIDLIVLTGGHSQWYFVRALLVGEEMCRPFKDISFPKIKENPDKLLQLPRPSETVALGLLNSDVSFDVREVSEYNVWFQARIGDEELPPLLLVRKNEILPFENNEIIYVKDKKIKQLVLTKCDLDLALFYKVRLRIGKDTIESAQTYEEEFSVKCNSPQSRLSYRGREFKAITAKKEYYVIEDNVTVALKVRMDDNGVVILDFLTFSDKHKDERLHMIEGGKICHLA